MTERSKTKNGAAHPSHRQLLKLSHARERLICAIANQIRLVANPQAKWPGYKRGPRFWISGNDRGRTVIVPRYGVHVLAANAEIRCPHDRIVDGLRQSEKEVKDAKWDAALTDFLSTLGRPAGHRVNEARATLIAAIDRQIEFVDDPDSRRPASSRRARPTWIHASQGSATCTITPVYGSRLIHSSLIVNCRTGDARRQFDDLRTKALSGELDRHLARIVG